MNIFDIPVIYDLEDSANSKYLRREAKGNAFSKAYSENINTNPQICFMKILDTPSQVLNGPSNVKMTEGTPEVRLHSKNAPKKFNSGIAEI